MRRRGRHARTATLAAPRTRWRPILLVDHNVRRVVKMSSYIYAPSLGKIIAEEKPEDFAGDLHEQVKAWLGINFQQKIDEQFANFRHPQRSSLT